MFLTRPLRFNCRWHRLTPRKHRIQNKCSCIATLPSRLLSSIRYKKGFSCMSKCETGNHCFVNHTPRCRTVQRYVSYKKIGDKNLASAISLYSSNLVRSNTLFYGYGVLHCAGPGILQSERIRKMRCHGKRVIQTSSNFRTFLGVLTPSGTESDRSDRRGHST